MRPNVPAWLGRKRIRINMDVLTRTRWSGGQQRVGADDIVVSGVIY